MKSRSTSLAVVIERLELELVDAVIQALRASASAALEGVLSSSARSRFSPNAPSKPFKAARARRAFETPLDAPPPPRQRRTRAAGADPGASAAPAARGSVPPPKDDALFAITDPSVVLAEVAEKVPPPPPRFVRLRPRQGPRSRTRTVESPALAQPAEPSEPAAPAPPPALREGEQVARAVLGGGVVLRRSRV
ncbi:MAG TPA: hypothetical protein VNO21_16255 [Polyangiaceae bacterium]|nr:hypothetical protein [Polyangiaceae bacterium]